MYCMNVCKGTGDLWEKATHAQWHTVCRLAVGLKDLPAAFAHHHLLL